MSRNRNFNKAKRAKKDEFYTQLRDIEDELKHYKHHFKNKVVYCNCDDPKVSNFFYYFTERFEELQLKKLITTCYKNKQIDMFSKENDDKAVKIVYSGDKNRNRKLDPNELELYELKGDGDFRSSESIEILKEVDIVVTNPPFSLFREYIGQLIKYNKKFLVIGHTGAVLYIEIFRMIRDNKIWLGINSNKTFEFGMPDNYKLEGSARVDQSGKKIAKVPAISWFTNLEHGKQNDLMILWNKYEGNENKFLKYYNYDAINVDTVSKIPKDYAGHIGVPPTFLCKYNPSQFEIIGLGISSLGKEIGVRNVKAEHKQWFMENKKSSLPSNGTLYLVENGIPIKPYSRIIIRNKQIAD